MAIDDTILSFTIKAQDDASGALLRFGQTVDATGNQVSSASAKMGTAFDRLTADSQRLADAMQQSVSRLGASWDAAASQIEGSTSRVTGSFGALGDAARTSTATLDGLTNSGRMLSTEFGQAEVTVRDLGLAVASTTLEVDDAGNAFARLTGEVSSVGREFVGLKAEVTNIAGALAASTVEARDFGVTVEAAGRQAQVGVGTLMGTVAQLDGAFTGLITRVGDLSLAMDRLDTTSASTDRSLVSLGTSADTSTAGIDSLTAAVDRLAVAQERVARSAKGMSDANVAAASKSGDSGLISGLGGAAAGGAGALAAAGGMAFDAAKYAGLGGAILGAGSIYDFAKLQSTMQETASNLNLSNAQMADMQKLVLQLYQQGPIGYGDIAKGAFHAFSIFPDMSPADMKQLVTEAWKASVATGADMGTVEDALARVMNNWHVGVGQTGQAMDVLHQVGARSDVTLEELTQYMGKPFAYASELGVSVPTAGAIFDTITKQTGNAGLASTLEAALFQHLMVQSTGAEKALGDMSGATGTDLQAIFSSKGVKEYGVMNVLKTFIDSYKEMYASDPQQATHDLQLILPGQRGLPGLLALMNNWQGTTADIANLGGDASGGGAALGIGVYNPQTGKRGGVTDSEQKRAEATTAYKWGTDVHDANMVLLGIGQTMQPEINSALDAAHKFFMEAEHGKGIPGEIAQGFRNVGSAIGDIVAKVPDMLSSVSSFLSPYITDAIRGGKSAITTLLPYASQVLGGAQDAASWALPRVGAGLGAAGNWIGSTGLPMAGQALGAAGSFLGDNVMPKIGDALGGVGNWLGDGGIQKTFHTIVDDAKSTAAQLRTIFSDIGTLLSDAFNPSRWGADLGKLGQVLSANLAPALEAVRTFGGQVKDLMGQALGNLGQSMDIHAFDGLGKALGGLPGLIDAVKAPLSDFGSSLRTIGSYLSPLVGDLSSFADGLKTGLGNQDWGSTLKPIADGFLAVKDALGSFSQSAKGAHQGTSDLNTDIANLINSVTGLHLVGSSITDFSDVLGKLAGGAIKGGIDLLAGSFKAFSEVFASSIRAGIDITKGFFQTIGDIAKTVGDMVSVVSDLFHGNWSQAWTDFKQVGLDALTVFKDMGATIIQVAKDIGTGLVSSFVDMGKAALAPIDGMVRAITGQSLPQLVRAGTDQVGAFAGALKDAAGTGAANFLAAVGKLSAQVPGILGQIANDVIAWGTGALLQGLVSAATGGVGGFLAGFVPSDIKSGIVSAFQSMLDWLGDKSAGLVGKFGTAGADAIGNLLASIGSSDIAKSVKSAGETIASDIKNGMASWWDAHNPFDWLKNHIPTIHVPVKLDVGPLHIGGSSSSSTPASGPENYANGSIYGNFGTSSADYVSGNDVSMLQSLGVNPSGTVRDTDFPAKSGTPYHLPDGGSYTLVSQGYRNDIGGYEIWQNTKNGGTIMFLHGEAVTTDSLTGQKSPSTYAIGDTVGGGTTVGLSGAPPTNAFGNTAGFQHLCVVTDANGRSFLANLSDAQIAQATQNGLNVSQGAGSGPGAPTGSWAQGAPSALQPYLSTIATVAKKDGISPAILMSMIMQESSGNPNVNSTWNAGMNEWDVGWMQVGGKESKLGGGPSVVSNNPQSNLQSGAGYLRYLYDGAAHHDWYTAVALYNALPTGPNYDYANQVFGRASGYRPPSSSSHDNTDSGSIPSIPGLADAKAGLFDPRGGAAHDINVPYKATGPTLDKSGTRQFIPGIGWIETPGPKEQQDIAYQDWLKKQEAAQAQVQRVQTNYQNIPGEGWLDVPLMPKDPTAADLAAGAAAARKAAYAPWKDQDPAAAQAAYDKGQQQVRLDRAQTWMQSQGQDVTPLTNLVAYDDMTGASSTAKSMDFQSLVEATKRSIALQTEMNSIQERLNVTLGKWTDVLGTAQTKLQTAATLSASAVSLAVTGTQSAYSMLSPAEQARLSAQEAGYSRHGYDMSPGGEDAAALRMLEQDAAKASIALLHWNDSITKGDLAVAMLTGSFQKISGDLQSLAGDQDQLAFRDALRGDTAGMERHLEAENRLKDKLEAITVTYAQMHASADLARGDLAGFAQELDTQKAALQRQGQLAILSGGNDSSQVAAYANLVQLQQAAAVVTAQFNAQVDLVTGNLSDLNTQLGTVASTLTDKFYAQLIAGGGANQDYLNGIEAVTAAQQRVQSVMTGLQAIVVANTGSLSDMSQVVSTISGTALRDWEQGLLHGQGIYNSSLATLQATAKTQADLTHAQSLENAVVGQLTGNLSMMDSGLKGLFTEAESKIQLATEMLGRLGSDGSQSITSLTTAALRAADDLGTFADILQSVGQVVSDLKNQAETQFARTGSISGATLQAYGTASHQQSGLTADQIAADEQAARSTKDVAGYTQALGQELTYLKGNLVQIGAQYGLQSTQYKTGAAQLQQVQNEYDGLTAVLQANGDMTKVATNMQATAAAAWRAFTGDALTPGQFALKAYTIVIGAATDKTNDLTAAVTASQNGVKTLGEQALAAAQSLSDVLIPAFQSAASDITNMFKAVQSMVVNATNVSVNGNNAGGTGGTGLPAGTTATGPRVAGTQAFSAGADSGFVGVNAFSGQVYLPPTLSTLTVTGNSAAGATTQTFTVATDGSGNTTVTGGPNSIPTPTTDTGGAGGGSGSGQVNATFPQGGGSGNLTNMSTFNPSNTFGSGPTSSGSSPSGGGSSGGSGGNSLSASDVANLQLIFQDVKDAEALLNRANGGSPSTVGLSQAAQNLLHGYASGTESASQLAVASDYYLRQAQLLHTQGTTLQAAVTTGIQNGMQGPMNTFAAATGALQNSATAYMTMINNSGLIGTGYHTTGSYGGVVGASSGVGGNVGSYFSTNQKPGAQDPNALWVYDAANNRWVPGGADYQQFGNTPDYHNVNGHVMPGQSSTGPQLGTYTQIPTTMGNVNGIAYFLDQYGQPYVPNSPVWNGGNMPGQYGNVDTSGLPGNIGALQLDWGNVGMNSTQRGAQSMLGILAQAARTGAYNQMQNATAGVNTPVTDPNAAGYGWLYDPATGMYEPSGPGAAPIPSNAQANWNAGVTNRGSVQYSGAVGYGGTFAFEPKPGMGPAAGYVYVYSNTPNKYIDPATGLVDISALDAAGVKYTEMGPSVWPANMFYNLGGQNIGTGFGFTQGRQDAGFGYSPLPPGGAGFHAGVGGAGGVANQNEQRLMGLISQAASQTADPRMLSLLGQIATGVNATAANTSGLPADLANLNSLADIRRWLSNLDGLAASTPRNFVNGSYGQRLNSVQGTAMYLLAGQ